MPFNQSDIPLAACAVVESCLESRPGCAETATGGGQRMSLGGGAMEGAGEALKNQRC